MNRAGPELLEAQRQLEQEGWGQPSLHEAIRFWIATVALTEAGYEGEWEIYARDLHMRDYLEELRIEAARLFGIKVVTIRRYIRSGRLPGRYEPGPARRGWVTTRRAVDAYRERTAPSTP